MVHDDEKRLLAVLQERTRVWAAAGRPWTGLTSSTMPYVREIVRELGINENRAAYICEKWTERGYYEYGVNVLAGWLSDTGETLVL